MIPNTMKTKIRLKELYEKAKPYYEKAKELKPDNKSFVGKLFAKYLLEVK